MFTIESGSTFFRRGEIPELFSDEEADGIITGMRNEVQGLGLLDSREDCCKFFIDQPQQQLKVNLTELKMFPNPPIAVTNVSAAAMALMAPRGKVPKDRSWKAAKTFMGKCVVTYPPVYSARPLIQRAEKCDEVQERVVSLKDCITYSVFLYTSRGLFERDKLTFCHKQPSRSLEDLCYLFGEIMYGGHIPDDWDRQLCHTYLEEFMHPDMGELTVSSEIEALQSAL
ncbi:Dynein heavy chain 11, axonemal [Acipenser ruthenus]|uniref:Dynein heavy chain 11, axonemal n=1 Tax=Acipenser ruthenus TaxID=7906 RepID=A0A444TXL4_ACIRT|nr:Dynein heavy chain 11, axonemal [Acipenser ruthenus]